MNRSISTVLIGLLVSQVALSAPTQDDYVPDEIIVKFRELPIFTVHHVDRKLPSGKIKKNVPTRNYQRDYPPYINGLVTSRNCEIITYYHNIGVFRLKIKDGRSEEEVIADFEMLPQVEYAHKNAIRKPLYFKYIVPDDTFYQSNEQDNIAKMELDDAWNYAEPLATLSRGSADGVIAVLDSGMNWGHEDVQGKRWENDAEVSGTTGIDDDGNGFIDDYYGWSWYDNSNDISADTGPDGDHGPHVSGVIIANPNNGVGIAGLAWNCKLMTCKGYPPAAIVYAADTGADVISMSWGNTIDDITERNALQYAYEKGVVLVASAGNSGDSTIIYPSAHPEVISVAASSKTINPWDEFNDDWCDCSPIWGSTFNEFVEVCSPVGCWGVKTISWTATSGYPNASGTSLACPQVSALGGVLMSWGITNADARYRIRMSADDVQTPGYDQKSGWGRINFFNACGSLVPPQNPGLNTYLDKLEPTWQSPNVSPFGIDHYIVLRANPPGATPTPVYTSPDNTVFSWEDTSVSYGQEYCYVIKAVDAKGLTTLASSEVCGNVWTHTQSETPTITETATYTSTPTITWTYTKSDTPTITPTATPTRTITKTATPSGTFTATGTITVTPSITRSFTETASYTYTPSPPMAETDSSYCYPQPARAGERMRFVYWLDKDAKVRILIYNIIGEKVDVVEGEGRAGADNQMELNLDKYAPGVYYYIMEVKKGAARTERYKPRKFAVVK